MVNLLPAHARRSLTLLYYSRFLTIVIFFLGLAFFAGALLLTPSYLLASADAESATRLRVASQKQVDLGSSGGVAGTFAELSERVTLLKTHAHTPVVAGALSALSTRVPKQVSLKKITLTPGEKGGASVSISGVAQSRSDLLAFVSTLQSVSVFEGVTVPVSALASDKNVAFTLSFSYVAVKP